jgi:hypothetical protein
MHLFLMHMHMQAFMHTDQKESSSLGHPIMVAARDPARARPADSLSALGSSMALDPFGSWLPGERE